MIKWVIAIVLSTLCLIISLFVVYNPTQSITKGFYFSYVSNDYHRNDLIMFCLPKLQSVINMQEFGLPKAFSDCPNQSPYLAKKIIALEGDYIDLSAGYVRINGIAIANSHIFNEIRGIDVYQANTIKQFYLTKDQFFVMGGSKYSYDSRYFGVIERENIYRKLKLIWNTSLYW